MIVLTIGPVQSYISQARRTQDLWQGSRILSFLASAAVHHAREQEPQATVIYPYVDENITDNIPNRIVVQWNGDPGGAQQLAGDMEDKIRSAWQTLSANTMDYFIESFTKDEDRHTVMQLWKDQEDSWLECYWVVVPGNDEPYQQTLHQANSALGSRKLLRNFPHIAERGRKCSITGEHEALRGADGNYVQFWKARKREQRNLALLGEHERLSAISTIKRFAHEEAAKNPDLKFPNRLPSTSSMAVAPYRYDVLRAINDRSVDTRALEQAIDKFITTLLRVFDEDKDLFFMKDGQYNPEYFGLIDKKQVISQSTLNRELVQQFRSIDGDFLFDDTLISKTLEEYSGNVPDEPQLRAIRDAHKALLRETRKLKIPSPHPYFVILSMDGDHMGKTLGKLSRVEQHRSFSQTLANFARNQVIEIVEDTSLGRVVYAGGDDVLALLPIRDALEIADRLRQDFESEVAKLDIKNHEGNPVTASTGLAYIHHTHNLQDAVIAANSAQKVAKDCYDRNAIAIRFLRRSGEPRSMGHNWEIDGKTSVVAIVRQLVNAFNEGLSHNLPYDVAQITYSMASTQVDSNARQAELQRVIKRRFAEQVDRANEIAGLILQLTAAHQNRIKPGWENAQAWLELARFIAQKEGDV